MSDDPQLFTSFGTRKHNRKEDNFFLFDMFKGFFHDWNVSDVPVVGGFAEAKEIADLILIARAKSAGEFIPRHEQRLLNDYIRRQTQFDERSASFKGGHGIKESITFAVDIGVSAFLTSWAAGTGVGVTIASRTGTKLSTKALGRWLKEMQVRGITEFANNRVPGKLIQQRVYKSLTARTGQQVQKGIQISIANSLATQLPQRTANIAASGIMLGSNVIATTIFRGDEVTSGVATRRLNAALSGKDPDEAHAFANSFADELIEQVSERSGRNIGRIIKKIIPVKTIIKFIMPKAMYNAFLPRFGDEFALGQVKRIFEQGQIQGIPEEILEERFGGFLRGLFGIDREEGGLTEAFRSALPASDEDFKVELLTIVPMGLLRIGGNYLGNRKQSVFDAELLDVLNIASDDLRTALNNDRAVKYSEAEINSIIKSDTIEEATTIIGNKAIVTLTEKGIQIPQQVSEQSIRDGAVAPFQKVLAQLFAGKQLTPEAVYNEFRKEIEGEALTKYVGIATDFAKEGLFLNLPVAARDAKDALVEQMFHDLSDTESFRAILLPFSLPFAEGQLYYNTAKQINQTKRLMEQKGLEETVEYQELKDIELQINNTLLENESEIISVINSLENRILQIAEAHDTPSSPIDTVSFVQKQTESLRDDLTRAENPQDVERIQERIDILENGDLQEIEDNFKEERQIFQDSQVGETTPEIIDNVAIEEIEEADAFVAEQVGEEDTFPPADDRGLHIDEDLINFKSGEELTNEKLSKRIETILTILYPEIDLQYTNTPITYQSGKNVFNQEAFENEVNFRLKVVDVLLSLSVPQQTRRALEAEIIVQPERITIRTNTPSRQNLERNLRKTLSGKGVTDVQIDFIFEYMKNNEITEISTADLALEISKTYSFSVEVEVNTVEENLFSNVLRPSNFYSSITVPGGFDYRENNINTPRISPTIKGHANFASETGIGWFRSDDAGLTDRNNRETFEDFVDLSLPFEDEFGDTWKKIGGIWFVRPGEVRGGDESIEREDVTDRDILKIHPKALEYDRIQGELDKEEQILNQSKTRRILEIQSDLFQQSRDALQLVDLDRIIDLPGGFFVTANSQEDVIEFERNGWITEDEYFDITGQFNFNVHEEDESGFDFVDGKFIVKPIQRYVKLTEAEAIELEKEADFKNDFLQLLNQRGKWVNFFVSSIIQDSAKKGYKKVRFPTGRTAAKVEGHQALEDYIAELKQANLFDQETIKRDERTKKRLEDGLTEAVELDDFVSISVEERVPDRFGDFEGHVERFESWWIFELKNTEIRIEGLENRISKRKTDISHSNLSLRPIEDFYENRIANILSKNYPGRVEKITDRHDNTWNEVTIEQNIDLGTILLQTNEANQIIGQANIDAGTVLIHETLKQQDTLPHEFAHHYVAWFRDSPIIQEGIARFGSEEAFVDAIGKQAVKQRGLAWNIWKRFTNWLFSNLSDSDIVEIVTDSFLTRTDLNSHFLFDQIVQESSGEIKLLTQDIGVKSIDLTNLDAFTVRIIQSLADMGITVESINRANTEMQFNEIESIEVLQRVFFVSRNDSPQIKIPDMTARYMVKILRDTELFTNENNDGLFDLIRQLPNFQESQLENMAVQAIKDGFRIHSYSDSSLFGRIKNQIQRIIRALFNLTNKIKLQGSLIVEDFFSGEFSNLRPHSQLLENGYILSTQRGVIVSKYNDALETLKDLISRGYEITSFTLESFGTLFEAAINGESVEVLALTEDSRVISLNGDDTIYFAGDVASLFSGERGFSANNIVPSHELDGLSVFTAENLVELSTGRAVTAYRDGNNYYFDLTGFQNLYRALPGRFTDEAAYMNFLVMRMAQSTEEEIEQENLAPYIKDIETDEAQEDDQAADPEINADMTGIEDRKKADGLFAIDADITSHIDKIIQARLATDYQFENSRIELPNFLNEFKEINFESQQNYIAKVDELRDIFPASAEAMSKISNTRAFDIFARLRGMKHFDTMVLIKNIAEPRIKTLNRRRKRTVELTIHRIWKRNLQKFSITPGTSKTDAEFVAFIDIVNAAENDAQRFNIITGLSSHYWVQIESSLPAGFMDRLIKSPHSPITERNKDENDLLIPGRIINAIATVMPDSVSQLSSYVKPEGGRGNSMIPGFQLSEETDLKLIKIVGIADGQNNGIDDSKLSDVDRIQLPHDIHEIRKKQNQTALIVLPSFGDKSIIYAVNTGIPATGTYQETYEKYDGFITVYGTGYKNLTELLKRASQIISTGPQALVGDTRRDIIVNDVFLENNQFLVTEKEIDRDDLIMKVSDGSQIWFGEMPQRMYEQHTGTTNQAHFIKIVDTTMLENQERILVKPGGLVVTHEFALENADNIYGDLYRIAKGAKSGTSIESLEDVSFILDSITFDSTAKLETREVRNIADLLENDFEADIVSMKGVRYLTRIQSEKGFHRKVIPKQEKAIESGMSSYAQPAFRKALEEQERRRMDEWSKNSERPILEQIFKVSDGFQTNDIYSESLGKYFNIRPDDVDQFKLLDAGIDTWSPFTSAFVEKALSNKLQNEVIRGRYNGAKKTEVPGFIPLQPMVRLPDGNIILSHSVTNDPEFVMGLNGENLEGIFQANPRLWDEEGNSLKTDTRGLRPNITIPEGFDAVDLINNNRNLFADLFNNNGTIREWEVINNIIPGQIFRLTRIPADSGRSTPLVRYARQQVAWKDADLIATHPDIQLLAGADNDADGRSISTYTREKNGRILGLFGIFPKRDLINMKDIELENAIFLRKISDMESNFDLFVDPSLRHLFDTQFEKGDAQSLQDQVEASIEFEEISPDKINDLQIVEENMKDIIAGANMIGLAAKTNAILSYLDHAGVEISDNATGGFRAIKNTTELSQGLGDIVRMVVDNAKNPVMGAFGINASNFNYFMFRFMYHSSGGQTSFEAWTNAVEDISQKGAIDHFETKAQEKNLAGSETKLDRKNRFAQQDDAGSELLKIGGSLYDFTPENNFVDHKKNILDYNEGLPADYVKVNNPEVFHQYKKLIGLAETTIYNKHDFTAHNGIDIDFTNDTQVHIDKLARIIKDSAIKFYGEGDVFAELRDRIKELQSQGNIFASLINIETDSFSIPKNDNEMADIYESYHSLSQEDRDLMNKYLANKTGFVRGDLQGEFFNLYPIDAVKEVWDNINTFESMINTDNEINDGLTQTEKVPAGVAPIPVTQSIRMQDGINAFVSAMSKKANIDVIWYYDPLHRVAGFFLKEQNAIYFNQAFATNSTLLHEFGHVMYVILSEGNPTLLANLVKIAHKDNNVASYIIENGRLWSEQTKDEEAFSFALGLKGSERIKTFNSEMNGFIRQFIQDIFTQKKEGLDFSAFSIDSSFEELSQTMVNSFWFQENNDPASLEEFAERYTEEFYWTFADIGTATAQNKSKEIREKIKAVSKDQDIQIIDEAINLRANSVDWKTRFQEFQNVAKNNSNFDKYREVVEAANNLTKEQLQIADEILKEYRNIYEYFYVASNGTLPFKLNYSPQKWIIDGQEEGNRRTLNGAIWRNERNWDDIVDGYIKSGGRAELAFRTASENMNKYIASMSEYYARQKLMFEGLKEGGMFSLTAKPGLKKVDGFRFDRKITEITDDGEQKADQVWVPIDLANDLNNLFTGKNLRQFIPTGVLPAFDETKKWNETLKMWKLTFSGFHAVSFTRSFYIGGIGSWTKYGLRVDKAFKEGLNIIKDSTPFLEKMMMNIHQIEETIGPDIVNSQRYLDINASQSQMLALLRASGMSLFQEGDYDKNYALRGNVLTQAMDKAKITKETKDFMVKITTGYQNWLFQEFGAGLKAIAAIEELSHEIITEQKKLGRDLVFNEIRDLAKDVATLINGDFGGLHIGRRRKMFGLIDRKQWMQDLYSIFSFAPDWTETNLSIFIAFLKDPTGTKKATKFAKSFIPRIAIRILAMQVALNLASAALLDIDDEDEDKDYFERLAALYRRAWDKGHLRWLMWDITPFYQMIGGEQKMAYFNVGGHFLDPLKAVPDLSKIGKYPALFYNNPIQFVTKSNAATFASHKSSTVVQIVRDLATGTDWTGRRKFNPGLPTGFDWNLTLSPGELNEHDILRVVNNLNDWFSMDLQMFEGSGKIRGDRFNAKISGANADNIHNTIIRMSGDKKNLKISISAMLGKTRLNLDTYEFKNIQKLDNGTSVTDVFLNGKLTAKSSPITSPEYVKFIDRENYSTIGIVSPMTDFVLNRLHTLPSFTLYQIGNVMPIPFRKAFDLTSGKEDFIEVGTTFIGAPIKATNR